VIRSGLRLALLPCLALSLAASAPGADLAARRKALDGLLKEQWEYTLRTSPEYASLLGDKRWNDKLTDFSQAAIDADLRQNAEFLKRFEAIDPTGFPDQERLNRDLMVRQLRIALDGARFKEWEMPLLQNSGIHIDLPQFVAMMPFETVKDYEDYAARLRQVPRVFEETLQQMRNGMKDGLMPPAFLLPKIAEQCDKLLATPVEADPFLQPLAKLPATFTEADKTRLRTAITEAVKTQVRPAYTRLAAFVRTEYAPKGRTKEGLGSLPDGQAFYAYKVKASTTTDLSPEAIHALGLREVARIEGEMLAVAKQLGYADLKAFNAAIHANPALHPKSRQEILDLYTKVTDQMYAKLPQLFGRLPKAKVAVRPVEAFREKEASAAAYIPGSPDGARPGSVLVNTGDFASRLTLGIETTALHEGVPGHHMQLAIAQELPELPPFRQQGNFTAYVEGWALYAERLGRQVGFFQDPHSFYGHLQDEMLRAIRLVVDTGLHAKGWSRQQVVDFFHAHSGIEEVEVQSETDRYIAWPGQALGYKVGQLKILELRAYAEAQLGKRFDLRAFHDEVLGGGALPLDILEARIKAWVARTKA